VEESDGAREDSEEVMTKSRRWLFLMGRKSHVLTEVERGEERQKLGSEVICGIIEEVACSIQLTGTL